MYVTFRQGIIKAPTNFLVYQNGSVNINTMDANITITASFGNDEYLITESRKNSATPAWIQSFSSSLSYWLFWDINTRTAQLTYTSTTAAPVYLPTAPSTPSLNTHWFNVNDNTMRVWDGHVWVEKIRVLAGTLINNAILTLAPVNTSQSGNNTARKSGIILFDATGNPIKRNLKSFLTTEDTIFYDNVNVSATNIEAKTLYAPVVEAIDAFSVVSTLVDGTLKLASAEDVGISNIAMAMDSASLSEFVSVTLQGKITNPAWNWTNINQLLWVDTNGQLTITDPNSLNPLRPSKSPVARVVAVDSIIFMPGLIAASQQTTSGISGLATVTKFGAAKLSVDAILITNPIVVGDNDPRNSNARTPLPHIHNASTIPTTAHNALFTSDVQSAINLLSDDKIGSDGGTIYGILNINTTPTNPNNAANKQYVDNMSTGFIFVAPVVTSTVVNIPVLTGLLVIDGVTLTVGDRVLVKNQINAIQNGIYSAATTAWTRTTDADETVEVHTGLYVFVTGGTNNSQTGWVLSSPNPVIPGTTPINFVQFNGLGQITVGNGLTKTGNLIAATTVSTTRLVSTLSGLDLATTGITPGSYNNIYVDAYGRIVSGSAESYLTANNTITCDGDVTGFGTTAITLTLANTAVTPTTYGDSTNIPVITVDAKGRITSATTVAAAGGGSGGGGGNQTITISGDATGSGTTAITLTLANTAVTPTTYGDSTNIPVITVDSKGRITSATTVATGEQPGGVYVPPMGDANYSSNSLLLHCNGVNTSTTFIDDSPTPHTVTVHGDTNIRTAQSKFGGASAYFDGTGDYLSLDGSIAFTFGTGDFTLECWFYTLDRNVNQIIFDFNDIGGVNGVYPYLGYDQTYKSFKYNLNGAEQCIGSTQVDNNTWYHVALCRASGDTKLYINGVNEGATFTNSDALLVGASAPIIGLSSYNSNSCIHGYLDDIRITKGVARYTSNFTVPSIAFASNASFTPPYYPVQWNNNGIFGGSNKLMFDNVNGYLGINKPAPVQALDVVGNIAATGTLTLGTPLATTQGGTGLTTLGTSLQVLRTNSGATGLEWATVTGGGGGGGSVSITNDTSTNATFYPSMLTTTSGTASALNVSDTQFTFNPSTGTLFATNVVTSSDEKLKENIIPITNGLDIITQLEPKQFTWRQTGETGYGVIAQEIEKLLPDLINEGVEYKSVNYNYLIGFLIAAVKDLSQQVEDNTAKITQLLSK